MLGDSCKFSQTVDVVFNGLGAGYEYEGERGRSCLTTTPLAKNINLLIKCVENCTYCLKLFSWYNKYICSMNELLNKKDYLFIYFGNWLCWICLCILFGRAAYSAPVISSAVRVNCVAKQYAENASFVQ